MNEHIYIIIEITFAFFSTLFRIKTATETGTETKTK